MATLRFWAGHFPDRQPEHYVFPKERYGAAGDKFERKAYQTDPTAPIGSLKEAWEAAKLRAAKIIKGIPEDGNGTPQFDESGENLGPNQEKKIEAFACRFHDLRHTAVSRMLVCRLPRSRRS